MGNYVEKQLWVTLAFFGQMVLPAAFGFGAVFSVVKQWKRGALISNTTGNSSAAVINEMSWQEFEMLVGEAFRRKGFSVSETGGGGRDGGVDLVLKKNNETFLVQCKQWRAFKVSVDIVRELYGVMAARGAAGGYVVTSGRFTDEAKEFASGRNIQLIEGPVLQSIINSAKSGVSAQSVQQSAKQTAPACPVCNGSMVKRTAKQGANAGSQFWGCPKYPGCRGTLPL